MTIVATALAAARARLGEAVDSAALDTEVLLAHVLRADRAALRVRPERELTSGELAAYAALIDARLAGTPVAYLTGTREFWSLSLVVTPATLVPRPDTETLVERSLARLREWTYPTVLELGTGSGAIALAIATERPDCAIVATDVSAGALDVAQRNAHELGIANVEFALGEWFRPVAGRRFDAIVSNPPYVSDTELQSVAAEVHAEPRLALAAGPDGLREIRRIVAAAAAHLDPGGWLLLEHGAGQAIAVRELLEAADFVDVLCTRDLGGHDRVTEARIGKRQT